MANLQKYRAHESLNTDSAAGWDVQEEVTVATAATSANVSGYNTIHIQTSEPIYFMFTTVAHGTTDSVDPNQDLYLVGGDTIYSLRIPKGLGNTVYIQWERKSSDSTVRYVLA